MRRLKDLCADFYSDYQPESAAERSLIRRAAMLTLQCELMEARWNATDGEAPAKALDAYQRTTGALRRTLESLGLERRPKSVTTDFRAMAQRAREAFP